MSARPIKSKRGDPVEVGDSITVPVVRERMDGPGTEIARKSGKVVGVYPRFVVVEFAGRGGRWRESFPRWRRTDCKRTRHRVYRKMDMPPLDEKTINRVLELRTSGLSLGEIAKTVRRTVGSVNYICRKYKDKAPG